MKTVYGPEDWAGEPDRDLGTPGEFPFTRGPYPNMYTGRLWTMRQYAGFGTAQETNRRFRQLLAAGQMGLSTAFDLPTQMGFDSDHPMAEGEVGRVGVAIDSVEDLAELFREIPLDRVSTSMTINATAAILLAMYIVAGEEQGVPRTKLTGTVQNDVLKEYIARGTYIYPAGPSLRLVADIFRFVSDQGMSFNPDLDQRLPYAGGRRHRGAGGRVYSGQCVGVRAGLPWTRGSPWTASVPGCRFSLPATTTCSRRRPSSGRLGGCGPGWYESASARATLRRGCGFIPRPAG